MLITWKESFSIDRGVIDDDHKFLIMTINTVIRRLNQRLPVSFLVRKAVDLRTLAALHFQREERLQELSGYPGRSGHQDEHEKLLAQLDEVVRFLTAQPEGASVADPAELKSFLYGWILGHIIESDQKLKPFVTTLDVNDEPPLGQLRRDIPLQRDEAFDGAPLKALRCA